MTKLTDLCDIQYGYAFDSGAFTDDESYPQLVRIRDVKRGYSETYYNGEYPEEYVLSAGDLLIGMDGEFNIARWKVDGALLNQRVCKIIAKDNADEEFLRFALSKALKAIEDRTSFATVKHLSAKELNKLEIPVPPYEEQKKISEILHRLEKVIDIRQNELASLDELIKARFVELFGTLDNPSQEFEKATLKELCNKITDGKHGGCAQEEGTDRYFVGAREIFDDEVHYETAPQINIEEFEKDYKRCNVEIGDFLIVNTGATIGKSAIASDIRTEHTLLQKSVALLKVKREVLNPVFLKWCYRVNTKMYLVESASAQPNLLLSKINSTVIYVPDISLQKQFADFVEQVDKSKVVVQKALNETQTLFDSLMQEYFG